MAEQDDSYLPRVTGDDFAAILFDDIVDPTHRDRLQRFAATNPELMRELGRRVYTDSKLLATSGKGNNEIIMTTHVINTLTFALAALEEAARREAAASDVGDDASPQL